jgi:hypothetical protein
MRRVVWALLAGACLACSSEGFAVRFSSAEYGGHGWLLRTDEPAPQRGTGGTRGWQLQAAAGDRASWFYTESINQWPPERALLLLVLEDEGAAAAGAEGSWAAAWTRPGAVARVALSQVADVRWLGDATRDTVDGVETERAPVVLRSSSAWGASLSGGFFVRGHVVCRRDARAPLIACAVAGPASTDEPAFGPADFDVDADLTANAEWLAAYVKGFRLTRR